MSSLDRPRFLRLWQRLGGEGDPVELFNALTIAYAAPHRAYHNKAHLKDCLAQFDLVRESAHEPDQVEIALWFHDAIYNPHAADNEAQSAAWAIQALTQGDIALTLTEQVGEFILATQHQIMPSGHDAQLMVDIDLSILGRAPAVFDEYDQQIRLEYQWVPEKQFCERRVRVLTDFLHRPVIYQTEHFYRQYEAQARQNLMGAIDRLTTRKGTGN
jgi:predicted metal-dependent HD superfamily phosphohydrolase